MSVDDRRTNERGRIVIVDDDAGGRHAMSRALERIGFDVSPVVYGQQVTLMASVTPSAATSSESICGTYSSPGPNQRHLCRSRKS